MNKYRVKQVPVPFPAEGGSTPLHLGKNANQYWQIPSRYEDIIAI